MGIVESLPPVDAAGASLARAVSDAVRSHDLSRPDEIGADRISDLVHDQTTATHWPETVRDQYRGEINHRIERDQYFLLLLGFTVCMGTLVIDALVSMAIFGTGAALRLATVVPITVLGLVAAARGWDRMVAYCLGAAPIAFMAVVAHIAMILPIEDGALYLIASALVLGIGNLTLPFSLRGLIGFNLAGIFAVSGSIALYGVSELLQHLGYVVVLMIVAVSTLLIVRRIERLRQHNFLLNLHARTTSQELLETNRQLQDLSNRDPLTGLANRRFFNRLFDELAKDACDVSAGPGLGGCQMAVLMIDLDHFKAFNDTHGHVAGDEALRIVGHELAAILSRVDGVAARYGGEEFVAGFCAASAAEAMDYAEEIRRHIATLLIPIWPSGRSRITASIGLAIAEAGSKPNREALIAVADEALYSAKRAGRNQVKQYAPELTPVDAAE